MKTFIAALLLLSSQITFARQIYWTGEATVYGTQLDCKRAAINDGEDGARRSCIFDYGIYSRTCNSAPVISTQVISSVRSYDGSISCEVRVYIEVP